MAEVLGQVNRPIDLTTDSHNNHIKRRTELLQKIPLKYLKFQEDVRPPYHGTYTSRPISSIASLARDFKRRDLPSTDYDYDSEAEWVEDEGDEDAEDCLNSDGEEEEEGDDLEDLDGFLDDENDEGLGPRKMATLGDLEPISTGLCWEDRKEQNTNIQMMPYRMEFLLEGPIKTIDPFSTEYWASTGSNMDPPRLPLHAIKGTSIFHNSPKSVKPFFGNGSQLPPTVAASQATKPVKLITADALDDFKRAVVGSNLTKVGLIEVLKKEFPKQTGAAIKGTLEMVAERVGDKHANKKWALIE
ncbi:chromatin assembly factor 1 subunit A [Phlyctema vagabunda]|uniref:Chromatin assembly factor 1 subunit A n=1 Tax=Phlyctema vagabunda TaxID=108571 RepID=A0ABR4PIY8_9HELO